MLQILIKPKFKKINILILAQYISNYYFCIEKITLLLITKIFEL